MTEPTDFDSGFDATRTSHTSSRLLNAGDVLAGRYRIEDCVGIGAMGTVYRAHDTRLNVTIALKVLHAAVAKDDEAVKRFESELRLARQITHPNVVRIHDIGEHENLSFLSMDLVEGKALDDILHSEGKLDPERAAKIAADIARGLSAAHAQGVAHRDLKPANILVLDDNTAVITDFGVARSIASARMTRTGFIVGTPDYLAPEQARGGDIDGRADIYALGLILYEMLTGSPPFSGGSLDELIVQRSLGRQPNLTQQGLAAPEYLRRIIGRCLQKSPDDRYADAEEIVEELVQGRSPRQISRPTKLLATFLLAVVVPVAGIALLWPDKSSTPPPTEDIATAREITTVAILPFRDQPPDPALAWISTTVAESLAAEVGASATLQVVNSQRVNNTLSDLHVNQGPPSAEIGMQLAELFGADWLISGTIENSGNEITVSTQLIAARTSTATPMINPVTVNLAKVNSVGTEIATRIRDALSLPAPDWIPARLSDDMGALRAYAMGVDLLRRGDSITAIEPLETATGADNKFAAAWLQLAQAYEEQGRIDDARKAIDQAVDHSGNDLNIANLARVRQAALGGDFDSAREILEQTVVARSGDLEAKLMLAELNGDQGLFAVAIEQLETLVAADPNHPRAWYLLAKFSIQKGDSQIALNRYLPTSLKIQQQLQNDQGQADALNAMGIAQHRTGLLEEAKISYLQSADIREKIGDTRGLGSSLANIARIELQLGQFDTARDSLDRAIEVRNLLQDQSGLAGLYNVYGVLEEEVSDYRAALRRYRQALQIRKEIGDQHALSNSFNNIAFAYFMLGEYDNAGVYWQQALDQSVETENPDAEMQAQQGLGQMRLAQGKWNEAAELFLISLETSRKLNFPDAEAVALGNLGRVAQRQGRVSAALSSYDDALTILAGLGDKRGIVEFQMWRAETWLEIGALQKASQDIATCIQNLQDSYSAEQEAYTYIIKGQLHARQQDRIAAGTAFDVAQKAGAQTGSDLPLLYLEIARLDTDIGSDASEIDALLQTVASIGNADLQMGALYAAANLALRQGDNGKANRLTKQMVALLKEHLPYARSWQIYQLAYNVYSAIDDQPAARDAQQQVQLEAQRILAEIPADATGSFTNVLQQFAIELR